MQAFHLHRAEGLGLCHQLRGKGQAQHQNGSSPRQPPPGSQSINGQGRQVDQPKTKEKAARQQRALQMGLALLHDDEQRVQHLVRRQESGDPRAPLNGVSGFPSSGRSTGDQPDHKWAA